MPICFFSIIKLALSSRFLLLLWHGVPCIMQGRKTGELRSISRNILFSPAPLYHQRQVRVIWFFFSLFICGSRETGNAAKQRYLTTAVHHNKSKMFQEIRRNYGPFSARVNFEGKAQIDGEQLSMLDGEIKYWTHSVWRTEARLKGSEHGESGYPLRGKTGGWEHLKNMTDFEMRANFKTMSTIERWMDRWMNR